MRYDLVKNLFFEVQRAKEQNSDKTCSELIDHIKLADMIVSKQTFKNVFDFFDSKYLDKDSNVYIVIRDLIAYKYVKNLDLYELTKPISYFDFVFKYTPVYKDLNLVGVALIMDYLDKLLECYQDMIQAGFDITCSFNNMMDRFISNFYQIKSDVMDVLNINAKIEETEIRDVEFENEVLKNSL